MGELNIEDYILRELSLDEQKVVMSFVCFLKDSHLSFYKDDCAYWKDKIYYWVKLDNEWQNRKKNLTHDEKIFLY